MVRLTKLSLAHRTVVLLLSLLTIGVGVYAATALKQELIPSIDVPRGSVVTVYAGAGPDVVEAQVSKPIESAVKAVDGVTQVTSTSSSGVSQVSVQWDYGIAADEMATKLRSAVDSIAASLPNDVDPRVLTGGTDDIPVAILALSSDEDLSTLSERVTDTVAPDLRAIAGVRDVAVSGQAEHEVVITYKQSKLQEYGVDPSTIAQLFAANSTAIPSGTMRTDTANLDVQTGTTFSTAKQVAALRVQGTDGPVKLSELATVSEQPVETTSISRVDGRTSLTLSLTKTPDANTVTVSHAIAERLPELERLLGNNASFVTVFDQAPYIEQSIHDLTVEGGIGLAMAVLVILLFLGSIRPTLITAISIPLSLLIALIGLWLGGYTLNILTLAALTVAIGRVVDDSIVVIENIKRHQSEGEYGRESITRAVREVAGAVTSSTLTTVAVFLPIGLVGGQAGEIFRPFAVAAVVALLASLFVSLTVVPVFASWFMRPTAKQRAAAGASSGTGEDDRAGEDTGGASAETNTWLQRGYLPVLNWSLAHRWITLLIAVAIFAGTLALVPRLKTDFIGNTGTESLTISQTLPSGTSLSQTDEAAKRIEALLSSDPSVQTFSTTIGGSSSAVFLAAPSDTNSADFTAPLKAGADATETADRLRTQIADLGPDVGEVEVSIGAGNTSSGVVVYVESSDPDALEAANQQVLAMMQGIGGLTNVTSDLADARDMLSVDVDEAKAAKLGMTQAGIGQDVARAVRGQLIGTLAQGDTTLNVYLRSRKPVRSVEELRGIKLPVTQLMNANAKSDAADKVQKRSDRLSAQSKRDATKAYNDQVEALRDSRADAVKARRNLNSQLKSARSRLAKLQRQLGALQQSLPTVCATNPADPRCTPLPASVYQLSQQVSGAANQVAQLSSALAQARSGVSSVDKQLEALAEQRQKTLDAQAQQQSITDDSKAAGDATADPVALSDVAKVSVTQAPSTVTRVDGTRAATITGSSESSDLGATTTAITNGLAALDLPNGVTVRIGGVSQQQQESFAQLGLAMVVAIAVVYLIMVATFGSLLQPLILLVSIPFAATGALGLSLLTDTALGIPSMIGLLMLIGIVVTNAIVLIDLINQKRRSGAGIEASIAAGARLRVRPIVMTALATIFALVPMSLGLTGGGVFVSKPLAIVVIGGLVSSTILTLILVPVLYDLLENWRQNGRDRRAARRAAASEKARLEQPEG
ncbi:efflux RND transporter permease subunit [Micropruina sonneratiae]|uniref:efflux RND transporter permease subunit n=1 Tax=Micropruina sonneratiae TaxID=2986940 RepID=UPI002227216B|nr:efflux RND transporter permease subunit [Micropruina sp. KQZ13P-5]MCW3158300.1 efflux RND transporter permease subunit [Micropruina sp. KQZ13P-5]